MNRIIAFIALAVSAPLGAQQLDRAARPNAAPAASFAFPTTHAHTLANGLRVLVVENHSVPVVSVRAVVATDSTWDPPGKEGLFAVTVGSLREGSAKRNADELARAAATIGTTVAPTGFTTVSSAFEPALELMAEMLTQPAFDSTAIERRKAQQSATARRVAQTPVTVPRRLFYALAYDATDPFVRSLLPTEASVAAITRADVRRFYDEFFSPRTTTIVVVGDVSESAATAAVTRRFGAWSARGEPPAAAEMRARVNDTKIYLHDVSGSQAYLFVGSLGPSRDAPDVAAAEVFGVVTAARLQQVLREKRSFMYSGTTGFTWRRGFAGTFVGTTTVSPQRADSALREWLGILRGIRTDQPVTSDELEAARRNRVGSLPARIDGPDSIATRLVEMVRDQLPADHFEQYARRMSSVTAAQVTAAANRYADPSHLIIVVTGQRSVLEPALRAAKLGPVVVVDALGKPVPGPGKYIGTTMTAKPTLTLITTPRPLPADHVERNPGMALDLDVVRAIRVNRSAVERRAATIPTRRTVKKEWQAGWLLRAITLIDLTTLSGDDTPGNVRRLCAKARHPLREDLERSLGVQELGIHVGAVCVYHAFVKTAVDALAGSDIPVAAVSTGFPAGLSPIEQRVDEIRASVAAGAREIDIVITRAHVLTGNYEALYDEVRRFRDACGDAHMKAILATGELATLGNVARASMVAMQAGADFIKTSTGKEGVNATIPFGVVMCRMIREYFERTGYAVGFKPAGGIRSAKNALEYLYLMKEELGDRWLRADLFRFGASSLLTDIERQLEHFVTGRYAAAHRQPMP